MQHISTSAAYQHISSISAHQQHISTSAAYQHISSISAHQQHISTSAAYQHISSISAHQQHITTQTERITLFVLLRSSRSDIWALRPRYHGLLLQQVVYHLLHKKNMQLCTTCGAAYVQQVVHLLDYCCIIRWYT